MPSAEQHTILLQGAGAWNRWRREKPRSVAVNLDDLRLTLCDKQWSAANGEPIDFSRASLRRADFRFATLEAADLRGTDLREADFRTARLKGANFAEAMLCGAQFAEADLADAMLGKADVRGADFSHARNFTLRQLSGTIGDETTVLPAEMPRPDNWEKRPSDTGEAKRERHVPTTWRLTRRGLAVCATLIVALSLISAVVIDPAPPSTAAPNSEYAPQPSTASAAFSDLDGGFAPSPSAIMQTSRALATVKLRTMAKSPGTSVAMAPTSARRIEVSSDTIVPVDASVLPLDREDAPYALRARPQVHLGEEVDLVALRDDGPREASRPLEAAPLPSSDPAAVVVTPAGPLTEVISRNAPVDTSLPLQREGSPDDPLLAYLNAPERSDRWIGELIERYYLSGMALKGPTVLSVYAAKVHYFGSLTPATEVARQKASYYAQWPIRSYALIPGSLAVKWLSADRAEIVFSYRYRVSSRKAHTAGRGRAILEIDFSQRPARITKEDGKLLSSVDARVPRRRVE